MNHSKSTEYRRRKRKILGAYDRCRPTPRPLTVPGQAENSFQPETQQLHPDNDGRSIRPVDDDKFDTAVFSTPKKDCARSEQLFFANNEVFDTETTDLPVSGNIASYEDPVGANNFDNSVASQSDVKDQPIHETGAYEEIEEEGLCSFTSIDNTVSDADHCVKKPLDNSSVSSTNSGSDIFVKEECSFGPSGRDSSSDNEEEIHPDFLSGSDECDFEVAFLEEDNNEDSDDADDTDEAGLNEEEEHAGHQEANEVPAQDPDPDDPDEDESHGSQSSSSSSSDSDSDNEPLFQLNRPALNRAVHMNRYRTVREGLLIFLALASANSWTYKSLIQSLQAENVLCGSVLFPTSTKGLWRALMHKGRGMTKHAYCRGCGGYLGLYKNLNPGNVRCRSCGLNVPHKKIKWFISVSIKKQLLHLLSIPDMREHLQYRNTRVKNNPEAYEDIFDGSAFLAMDEGDVLSVIHYVFETDGLRLGKNPHAEAWALQLRIVDLPHKLRQKHTILAGIWVDNDPITPCMNTFLRPFVKEANRLSQEGVMWRPDRVNEKITRFVPLCMCVDYKARPPILNMVQYNSHRGCFICDHIGVYAGGSMRYPSQPHPDVPPFQLRTDENVREDMLAAHDQQEIIRGFKGVSRLLLLRHFRIAEGNVIDNLHTIFLRVVPPHVELLLRQGPMPLAQKVRRINRRFLKAKPPDKISRTPWDFKKREKYKASEWRNWLLHYSVPCLEDLDIPQQYLDHWQMLSYATFLLMQDSIKPEDVDMAERLFQRYVELYEEHFGLETITPCLHLLTHLATVVRRWGPLQCYSMFYFESYQQKILSKVTSPKGCMLQIVTRHLMNHQVVSAMYHQEGICDEVREFIVEVMSKNRHSNVTEIDGVYLLGDGTVRAPNQQEMDCLAREGFHCDNLREFKRVIIDSVLYHSSRENPDRLHDSSAFYSRENTFCIINSIVIVSHHNAPDFCGVFVTELDVLPFPQARHIGRIRIEGNLPHFLRVSHILGVAVKHEVLGELYVSPLPNHIEID